MMFYKQREIVLVKFVFSEGAGFKKRPALIVSSSAYHQARQEVIIAAITSNTERILAGDTLVEDWKKANLLYPSLVTGILQTIKQDMIERRFGSLSVEDFHQVQKNLCICLGLSL